MHNLACFFETITLISQDPLPLHRTGPADQGILGLWMRMPFGAQRAGAMPKSPRTRAPVSGCALGGEAVGGWGGPCAVPVAVGGEATPVA